MARPTKCRDAGLWRPTEAQFQAAVIALAGWNDWRCYHTHDSRHSPAGFPDLCMVRPPRFVVAELKIGQRQPTVMQRLWLDAFSAVPAVEVHVWRPEDWDQIEQTLRRERKRRASDRKAG